MALEDREAQLWCRVCGPEHRLRVEMRLESAPIGSFSLSGVQMKVTAKKWPYAVCDNCGRASRGQPV